LTPAEYQSALTTLGLTTEQAAKWLGIGRSTAFRYAVDGAPGPVARALGMAVACKVVERFIPELHDPTGSVLMTPYENGGRWVRHSDLTAAVGLEPNLAQPVHDLTPPEPKP